MAYKESIKLCGLCSQLVDTSVDLNESILGFLSEFLSIAAELFPPKVCTDCFSSALDAKRFKETCQRAIKKIKRSKALPTSGILGSPRRKLTLPSKVMDSLQVQIPITERIEADRKFESEGCSYSKSSPSRKRTSGNHRGAPSPKKRSREVRTPSPKRRNNEEDLDSPEVFPSVGPYQCEICFNITDTKHEFVCHIKEHHRNVVDEEVLESLEMDLKKVERRLRKAQKRRYLHSSSTSPSSPPESSSKGKNFVSCPQCSTRMRKQSLRKHLQTKACRGAAKKKVRSASKEYLNNSDTIVHVESPVEKNDKEHTEESVEKKKEEEDSGAAKEEEILNNGSNGSGDSAPKESVVDQKDPMEEENKQEPKELKNGQEDVSTAAPADSSMNGSHVPEVNEAVEVKAA